MVCSSIFSLLCFSFNLRKAASTVVCFDVILLVIGIVLVSVPQFDSDWGIAAIILGAIGVFAAFLGLCAPRNPLFLITGALASGILTVAFVCVAISTAVWMSTDDGTKD